ncbi:MAG: type II secretion system protein GspG [Phycisphaerales bacterium]
MFQTQLRHSRPRRTVRRAFSLLEVVVAVTIVAILAAVVAPRFLSFIGKARSDRAKAEATQLAQVIKLYLTTNGLTSTPDGFELVWLTEGVNAPLESKKDLLDPWGREYIMRTPGTEGRDFDIVSLGRDGVEGGEGEDADIVHGNK